MIYPFDDASIMHFEVDTLGESAIDVMLTNGHVISCDRVDFVLAEHIPFAVVQIAVESEGEQIMFPRDIIPHTNVQSIRNHVDKEVTFLGVGQ